MSGGSFEYLYLAELTQMRAQVEAMRDQLEKYGHSEAARRTGEVIQHMDEIEKIQGELRSVWETTEWCVSGDWNEKDVSDAVAKWSEPKG